MAFTDIADILIDAQDVNKADLRKYLQNRETVNVRDHGATGDGVTNDSPGFVAATALGGAVTIPAGSYSLAANVGVGVDGTVISGAGYATEILLSGDNRRAFNVTADNVTLSDFYIDGQKPLVGWETADNFDFGIRVGEAAVQRVKRLTVRNGTFKDIGLDGIYIQNCEDVLIENVDLINCRRAGLVVTGGSLGAERIVIRNVRAWCDFGGGPGGKEYPLFAIDIEPNNTDAEVSGVSIDNVDIYDGALAFPPNHPATAVRSSISNSRLYGARANLAITSSAPNVSNVVLYDGAYLFVDTDDSVVSNPYIENLQIPGNVPKLNADGRANILPRDFIHQSDGVVTTSGSGSMATVYSNLDGLPSALTEFTLGPSTGNSYVTIPTDISIAEGDHIFIALKVDRTDSSADDAGGRFLYASLGVDDRHIIIPKGAGQWVVWAYKASAAATNPNFIFGLTGTISATVKVRCTLAQVFVNSRLIDMPTMRVEPSSPTRSRAYTGPTLTADNSTTQILNAGTAQNMDTIEGPAGQTLTLRSAGSAITVRDQSISSGNIKLKSGTSVVLTTGSFTNGGDGFWYQVS